MQHVVDASVVAKWFLPEPHKDKAEKLLRDFLEETVELTAPDLIVAEVGNLLWKRSTLLQEISANQAAQSYRHFLSLPIQLHPSPAIAATALKLAADERRQIYDMLYIALAQQNACEFITADEKLLRALGKKFSCLRWIGDL
jgi:predicted nucleic acid-binding protein